MVSYRRLRVLKRVDDAGHWRDDVKMYTAIDT